MKSERSDDDMTNTWEGWHFLREDRRLSYPPHTLVEPGQTLKVDPPIALCDRGLHAGKRVVVRLVRIVSG